MRVIRFTVGECEHEGDIQDIISDIEKCGGQVGDLDPNEEAETCEFFVNVEDPEAFKKAFLQTDSGAFI